MNRKKFWQNLSPPRKMKPLNYNNKEETELRGEDSQLFQAISPAFYIIRVFGLGPYHFAGDRLVPSNVHLIFSILGLLFNSYVSITVLVRFSIKGNQPILGVTEQVKVILNYGTSIVNILVAMCTRESVVQVWTMIQDFDYHTNILGFPQMESGTKFRVWSIISINTLLWLWINQAGMMAFSETWLQNVMEKLHENLMTASRKLDSVYSWPLLFWLFNLCSHTVSNTYFIITAFMDHDFEMHTQICLVGWFIIYVLQLLVLHVACDFTSNEANRLGDILLNWRKWQVFNDDTEFESTLYLLNYKLNFSAAGCCYVNLLLLRSITGLLCTYLIILLQLPH